MTFLQLSWASLILKPWLMLRFSSGLPILCSCPLTNNRAGISDWVDWSMGRSPSGIDEVWSWTNMARGWFFYHSSLAVNWHYLSPTQPSFTSSSILLSHYQVSHIFREGNGPVDFIANMGSWPPMQQDSLRSYCTWLMPTRLDGSFNWL